MGNKHPHATYFERQPAYRQKLAQQLTTPANSQFSGYPEIGPNTDNYCHSLIISGDSCYKNTKRTSTRSDVGLYSSQQKTTLNSSIPNGNVKHSNSQKKIAGSADNLNYFNEAYVQSRYSVPIFGPSNLRPPPNGAPYGRCLREKDLKKMSKKERKKFHQQGYVAPPAPAMPAVQSAPIPYPPVRPVPPYPAHFGPAIIYPPPPPLVPPFGLLALPPSSPINYFPLLPGQLAIEGPKSTPGSPQETGITLEELGESLSASRVPLLRKIDPGVTTIRQILRPKVEKRQIRTANDRGVLNIHFGGEDSSDSLEDEKLNSIAKYYMEKSVGANRSNSLTVSPVAQNIMEKNQHILAQAEQAERSRPISCVTNRCEETGDVISGKIDYEDSKLINNPDQVKSIDKELLSRKLEADYFEQKSETEAEEAVENKILHGCLEKPAKIPGEMVQIPPNRSTLVRPLAFKEDTQKYNYDKINHTDNRFDAVGLNSNFDKELKSRTRNGEFVEITRRPFLPPQKSEKPILPDSREYFDPQQSWNDISVPYYETYGGFDREFNGYDQGDNFRKPVEERILVHLTPGFSAKKFTENVLKNVKCGEGNNALENVKKMQNSMKRQKSRDQLARAPTIERRPTGETSVTNLHQESLLRNDGSSNSHSQPLTRSKQVDQLSRQPTNLALPSELTWLSELETKVNSNHEIEKGLKNFREQTLTRNNSRSDQHLFDDPRIANRTLQRICKIHTLIKMDDSNLITDADQFNQCFQLNFDRAKLNYSYDFDPTQIYQMNHQEDRQNHEIHGREEPIYIPKPDYDIDYGTYYKGNSSIHTLSKNVPYKLIKSADQLVSNGHMMQQQNGFENYNQLDPKNGQPECHAQKTHHQPRPVLPLEAHWYKGPKNQQSDQLAHNQSYGYHKNNGTEYDHYLHHSYNGMPNSAFNGQQLINKNKLELDQTLGIMSELYVPNGHHNGHVSHVSPQAQCPHISKIKYGCHNSNVTTLNNDFSRHIN